MSTPISRPICAKRPLPMSVSPSPSLGSRLRTLKVATSSWFDPAASVVGSEAAGAAVATVGAEVASTV